MFHRPRSRKKKLTLCKFAAVQESRVEIKVQALGVVELCPLLVLPPTVNAIVEVAVIDPVLQDRQETHNHTHTHTLVSLHYQLKKKFKNNFQFNCCHYRAQLSPLQRMNTSHI